MKIEVYVDITSPWSYIAKHRFASVLRGFEQRRDVHVEWKSFELEPWLPMASPRPISDYLAVRLGLSSSEVRHQFDIWQHLGDKEGIAFRFEGLGVANTRHAHQLLYLAAVHGLKGKLLERLFQAYFQEGRKIDHAGVLLALAMEVGLEEEAVRKVLAEGIYLPALQKDAQAAVSQGVNTAPFVLIDGRVQISGLQSRESYLAALERTYASYARGREQNTAWIQEDTVAAM
jgi:predicted DsbA family dithiol-disulfide isomerase